MKPRVQEIKLPDGFHIGQRIRTTRRYAICHLRAPGPFNGTIVGGSEGNEGPVTILLDHHTYAKALFLSWFEVIG